MFLVQNNKPAITLADLSQSVLLKYTFDTIFKAKKWRGLNGYFLTYPAPSLALKASLYIHASGAKKLLCLISLLKCVLSHIMEPPSHIAVRHTLRSLPFSTLVMLAPSIRNARN